MKKATLLLTSLIAFCIALTSFKTEAPAATLYPKLDAYFSSLDMNSVDKDHLAALGKIKEDIKSSSLYFDETNLVFYCSENSFRSQASEVFMETLCAVKKRKKVKVYSTGVTVTEVNPKLINYLTEIGYKVSKISQADRTVYEVRFSDKNDPIVLYSKNATDKSLPSKNVTPIIVCDAQKEVECKNIKTETTPINLPFQKVLADDNDEKIRSTIKSIATEMLYVTNK